MSCEHVQIKADRLVKWRSCTVDGSVTSICIDAASANDVRLLLAVMSDA